MSTQESGRALFTALVRIVSEQEDACADIYYDRYTGDIDVVTTLGFEFRIAGRLVRKACAGMELAAFTDALEAAYEASVYRWLREGPWL